MTLGAVSLERWGRCNMTGPVINLSVGWNVKCSGQGTVVGVGKGWSCEWGAGVRAGGCIVEDSGVIAAGCGRWRAQGRELGCEGSEQGVQVSGEAQD